MHFEKELFRKEFSRFWPVFEEKAREINLVSFKSKEEFYYKHFWDSAFLLKFFDLGKGKKVLDVGTGGGLPGLVLALACPETEFVLLDSIRKKLVAVQAMIETLKLSNVKVITGRAEEFGHNSDYRESFDWVVSRAVASLPTLLEYAVPFVKPGHMFVAYKGPNFELELESSKLALLELRANLHTKFCYELPQDYGKRTLIAFEKKGTTPLLYPRKVGIPMKKPLK